MRDDPLIVRGHVMSSDLSQPRPSSKKVLGLLPEDFLELQRAIVSGFVATKDSDLGQLFSQLHSSLCSGKSSQAVNKRNRDRVVES